MILILKIIGRYRYQYRDSKPWLPLNARIEKEKKITFKAMVKGSG